MKAVSKFLQRFNICFPHEWMWYGKPGIMKCSKCRKEIVW